MYIVIGAVFVTAAILAIAVHLVDSTRQSVLVAGALARTPMWASVPGTVLLTIGVGWVGALLGLAVMAAAAWTQWPLVARRLRAKESVRDTNTLGTPFTVLHANILLGGADADAIVALLERHRPDVLTVVELTPSAHERLLAAGLAEHLPYSFVSPAGGGEGSGIYSRHPLDDVMRHDGYAAEQLSARVEVPGGPTPLVFALHPVPPWPRSPQGWVRELASIRQMLAKIPAEDGPVIVGGDFNATFDHKLYRNLLTGSYRDAAIEVGAGHLATYHADMRIPPLIAIDHILVRGAAVTEVGTVDLPGSDHRGLRAALLL
ncbi:MAG: endonuclease/exonuclease/phosphatase (EEP) superfamily protein YafD [Rhodococcus sp. (in: high G+C Gram-positive bacteria)]|jgi:endonuclease/exonuclease/phosphatase (EEP) superfamily protein YafD